MPRARGALPGGRRRGRPGGSRLRGGLLRGGLLRGSLLRGGLLRGGLLRGRPGGRLRHGTVRAFCRSPVRGRAHWCRRRSGSRRRLGAGPRWGGRCPRLRGAGGRGRGGRRDGGRDGRGLAGRAGGGVAGGRVRAGAGVPGGRVRAGAAGAAAGFRGVVRFTSAATRAACAARVAAGSGSKVRARVPVGPVGTEPAGGADARARARAEPGIGRRGSSRSWMTGATMRMTSSSLAEASGSRRTP